MLFCGCFLILLTLYMAKVNKKQTSKKVASIASALLKNSKSKKVRSVAASDLAQAHNHAKAKASKK